MPKVSVVMPVYNTESFVREAIESILQQTFKDFEFLILNDGSHDKSAEIIYGFKDQRIKFINYDKNTGLLIRLNDGLKIAQGKYIVRMDSDDISLPRRLEKQVKFMDSHREIGVSGSWVVTIGLVKDRMLTKECDEKILRCKMLFGNPLLHPTVIMRASVIREHNLSYQLNYYHSEDYKMWLDMSRYSKCANIPEVLLKYRIHSDQISQQFHLNQKSNFEKIANELLSGLEIKPTLEEINLHCSLDFGINNSSVSNIKKWFNKLNESNTRVKLYPEQIFLQVLAEEWCTACFRKGQLLYWIKESFIKGFSLGRQSFLYPKHCFIAFIKILEKIHICNYLKRNLLR